MPQVRRVPALRVVAAALAWLLQSAATAGPRSAVLAKNGATDYVLTGQAAELDIALALTELAEHLKAATGADFRAVPAAEAARLPRRIVVGTNAPASSIVGATALASLRPDESLVVVKGRDVVLAGGSPRASLYAAYSFLENDVGCRWYARDLAPCIPRHARLAVRKATRRERPAFSRRDSNYDPGVSRFALRNRFLDPRPLGRIDPAAHTFFFYIPPHAPDPAYAWLDNYPPQRKLFETRPDFFSMTAASQRVDNLQLCFSNPDLRAVLTRQIDAVIRKSKHRDHGYIALDANDVPGRFCCCPACRQLEEKYDNVGGPLYDYLPELCAFLRKEHPGVLIKILAYRKEQTERPPRIGRLPDNVIVQFAPIDNNFTARLDHPTNLDSLNNLKRWREMAGTVWVWYYTNPYIVAGPPFVNLRCIADDIRILRAIGVDDVKYQQTTGACDHMRGLNCADLETWLVMKLNYDPDQDAERLIEEFAKHYYGRAGSLMSAYLAELESLRERMTAALPNANVPSFPMFTYVTPERVIRWEQAFDKMEALTAGDAETLRNVRTARITLDVAALTKWHEMAGRQPRLGLTAAQLAERIQRSMAAEIEARCAPGREAQCWGAFGQRVEHLLLRAQVTPKPLPQPFDAMPPNRVREILPPAGSMTNDADAACGVAVVGACRTDPPVSFGLYDDYRQKWVLSRTIARDDIQPNRYGVYRLGRATLSPQCRLWMTDAWVFTIPLEEAYQEGDPLVEWEIYASLKFTGPKYGSADAGQGNRIACDRVVLVRAESGGDAP